MKRFLINLAITVASVYAFVSFVSYTPNPIDWDEGGRAAFALFSLLIAGICTAFQDSDIDNQKSKI